MNTISIQVPSIMENIRMIESFIDNAKEKFDLDDDIYGNIMIAVTEAVNNAIKHGKSAKVAMDIAPQSVAITIDDQDITKVSADSVREIAEKHRKLLVQRYASGAKLQYRGRWLLLDVRPGGCAAARSLGRGQDGSPRRVRVTRRDAVFAA